MSKRYSGKSFKDSSVMKKPKLTFKEKRKLKEEKKRKDEKTFRDLGRHNRFWYWFICSFLILINVK